MKSASQIGRPHSLSVMLGDSNLTLVRPTSAAKTDSRKWKWERPKTLIIISTAFSVVTILLIGLGAYSTRSTVAPTQPVHIAQSYEEDLVSVDDRNRFSLTPHTRFSLTPRTTGPEQKPAYWISSYQHLLGGYSRPARAARTTRDSAHATTVQALARRKREPQTRQSWKSLQQADNSAEEGRVDFARSCKAMGMENWMSWATEGQDQDEATCPTQQSSTRCRTLSASTFCGLSWRPLMSTKHTSGRGAGSCAITNEQVWCFKISSFTTSDDVEVPKVNHIALACCLTLFDECRRTLGGGWHSGVKSK